MPLTNSRQRGVLVDRDRLDHELQIRGLSILDLGRAAGIAPETITNARHGRRIQSATLKRILTALQTIPVVPLALGAPTGNGAHE